MKPGIPKGDTAQQTMNDYYHFRLCVMRYWKRKDNQGKFCKVKLKESNYLGDLIHIYY